MGSYAFHQTHSRSRKDAQERRLSSCTVCAMTRWLDDLRRVKLFVQAAEEVDGMDVEQDLEEEPEEVPGVLEILASNPVVQARFFVLSMRLFLEHILGIMHFDDQLRPNGSNNGVVFPDGGLQEEHFVPSHHFMDLSKNKPGFLVASTDEAKVLLRRWQTKTLEAVESLMSSCTGLFTLHFKHTPFDKHELQALPYHKKWQEEDKFDGGSEDCQKDATRVRDLDPLAEPYVDLHLRGSVEAKQRPLTGAVMSRLPHYRLLPGGFLGCQCRVCEQARSSSVIQGYAADFAADLHGICSLSGHLHEHQQTCFKYSPENSRKKPQHCRFNFVHFVKLFRKRKFVITSGSGHPDEVCEKVRLKEIVVARTGKEDLGSSVEDGVDSTQRGRIKTVQHNPREGQCFPASR
eukprot:s366_g45.t1